MNVHFKIILVSVLLRVVAAVVVWDLGGQDEEDRPPGAAPRAPRTFFVDAEGRHFSVWKCLLQGHAPGTSFEANHATIGGTSGADLETALRDLSAVQGARWVVLLASGGHFAGAVFQVRLEAARAS